MTARQATRQEVLDAVCKASVYSSPVYGDYDEKQGRRPVLREERKMALATKMDVAERVVNEWGDSPRQRQYVSRASMLREFVSLTSVKKNLQDLVSDGIIVAVPGDHWSIARRYGSSRKAVYYLSGEAMEIAERERQARLESNTLADAQERAREAILAKYAAQYETLVDEFLAERGESRTPVLWPTPQESLLIAM